MKHAMTLPETAVVLVLVAVVAAMACGRSADPDIPVAPTAAEHPVQEYSAEIAVALEAALTAYEDVREPLAQDRLEEAVSSASLLGSSLRMVAEVGQAPPGRLGALLDEAARAAESLAESADISAARKAFGEVSRLLIPVVAADSRLSGDRHVFACPMVKDGFNKWMQPSSDLENPFMGQAMPGCGDETDWTVAAPLSSSELESHVEYAHEGDISHYTCSMHPSVQRQEPGTCPICSMDLVPVTREEVTTGIFTVDAGRRQLIGVRTTAVQRRPVRMKIRALGRVVYDETRLTDVSLKYRGWIGKLEADRTGQQVSKGEPLFDLYSPELYSAQEEYLAALASQSAAKDTSAPHRSDYLVEAARKRLRLWDLRDWQIDQLASTRSPLEYIPIVSPVSGFVIEKEVVQGAAVEPGRRLYRIAGLDRIWIEADIYESELPLIEVGQQATVSLPYLPGKRFLGRVGFVYPYLEDTTRTGRIRIELANEKLELRPDMFADVELTIDLGERLVVPEEAILYAGPRRLVFLDLGEGRLRPQEIEIGIKSGNEFEVLAGLDEGDVVVSSGNFLIAAESRLKSAEGQW